MGRTPTENQKLQLAPSPADKTNEMVKADEYPHHKRALTVYSQWLSGYGDEEIAEYFQITPSDVRLDIMHMQGQLQVKTLVAQWADRNRLMIQRDKSHKYMQLLDESLSIPAETYIENAMQPAIILKEFREAVGMTERSDSAAAKFLIQQNVNVQQNSGGPQSSEDVIRSVLRRINTRVIDTPVENAESPILDAEEEIPDPDE